MSVFTYPFVVVSLLQRQKILAAGGKIKKINVEVYSDPEGTIVLGWMDWGYLETNEVKNYTVYVTSTGNFPWITLNMNISEWSPIEAENWINVTWDREDYTFNKFDLVETNFTIAIDSLIPSNITNFFFTITITGTG